MSGELEHARLMAEHHNRMWFRVFRIWKNYPQSTHEPALVQLAEYHATEADHWHEMTANHNAMTQENAQ